MKAGNFNALEAMSEAFGNGTDWNTLNSFFMQENDYLYTKILDEFKRSQSTHKEGKTIALLTLYAPIFFMAFVGNVMVLFVVLPNRHMRNVTNFFLVNLAVADLTGKSM